MPPPTTTPERASLLGLPLELRHCIYDFVRLLPPTCAERSQPFRYGRHLYSRRGGTSFGAYIDRCQYYEFAWLNLQIASATISEELRQHLLQHAAANDHDNDAEQHRKPHTFATYDMRILAGNTSLQEAEWTCVPCAPWQCRSLHVNAWLPAHTRFKGSGGPCEIVLDLYQTLNRFLHYGPVLDSKRSLQRPLTLDTVSVCVRENTRAYGPRSDWDRHEPADNAGAVLWFARELNETGLLYGLVGRIVVYAQDEGMKAELVGETEIERRGDEPAEVPAEWKAYGYQWGVLPP